MDIQWGSGPMSSDRKGTSFGVKLGFESQFYNLLVMRHKPSMSLSFLICKMWINSFLQRAAVKIKRDKACTVLDPCQTFNK